MALSLTRLGTTEILQSRIFENKSSFEFNDFGAVKKKKVEQRRVLYVRFDMLYIINKLL